LHEDRGILGSVGRLGGCGGSLGCEGIGLVDYALYDGLLVGVEVCGERVIELWLFLLKF
jgi:hypothetical protein